MAAQNKKIFDRKARLKSGCAGHMYIGACADIK
jgi:hypothetical protein